jgi:hypothetical protein
MTQRQKSLLWAQLIWFLLLLFGGVLGGVGTVELSIWLLGVLLLLAAMVTWGRHPRSR